MASLSLLLFGEVQITYAGDLVEITTCKALALVVYLAVTCRPQSRDILAALLWPDTEQSRARANLRRLLWILNQTPVGTWIEPTAESIFLKGEALTVDTSQFSQLLQADKKDRHALSKAIELYQGDFLASFHLYNNDEFESWVREQRENYRQQMLAALHRLASYQLQQGEFEAALSTARRHITLDNLSEKAYGQLFVALAGSGKRTTALAEFEMLRSLLEAELATEPSQVTRQLIERIRTGQLDPAEIETFVTGKPTSSGPIFQLVGPETSPSASRATNPYRGLFSFREEHAPFFFGREDITNRLVHSAQHQPLIAIIGSSGCGKSSIVHAGLIAGLRRQEDWLIGVARPGDRPFQALAGTLVYFLEPELGETGRLVEAQRLAGGLEKGEIQLPAVIDRIQMIDQGRRGDDRRRRFLLVIDQFEELFTLVPDMILRHRFFDILLDLISDQQHRFVLYCCLVFTLRADFLDRALEYRPLADALQGQDIKLGPMTRGEMTRAIVNPAHLQGAVYEPGLVSRFRDDVGPLSPYL